MSGDLVDAPRLLHWDEPDAGCVSCGETYLTVDDHRCASCVDDIVRHCPLCLGDIAQLIDREVVRRVRQASHDVNDRWTSGKYLSRLAERQLIAAEDRRRRQGPVCLMTQIVTV